MFHNKTSLSYFKIFSATLMLSLLSACSESFLDIPDTSTVDSEVAIQSVSDMQTVLNGLYNRLGHYWFYGRNFPVIAELMSDNVYLSGTNSGRYTDINDYIVTKDNEYAYEMYHHIYKMIVNANILINSASKVDGDESKKNAVLGQAYALRALGYFDLARLYGQPYNDKDPSTELAVPLVLESTVKLPDKIPHPKRSSVKKVYDRVIKDFKKAISLLPTQLPGSSSSFKGKITKNAAKALLSRVYLYTENWKGAESMAADVINSDQYKLLSTNDLVSDFNEDNNSESIFEIIYTSSENEGTNSLFAFYNQDGGSYADALPTWNLYNIYDSTDVRRDFMKIGDRRDGPETNIPLAFKFTDSENDFKVIRLAEVYLNRAEAEARLGKEDDAIADLKKIAKRAEPSVTINGNLKGQALVKRILLERRKELAFEGQRIFDLTRNKKTFKSYYTETDYKTIDSPSEKTILPIPKNAIDANKNLEQNPGY
jgi:hypothetical protein